jgi:NADH-quinone oxidoreductase subunit J
MVFILLSFCRLPMLTSLLFICFFCSCFLVISCRNPIFSLLSLIGSFIFSGVILLCLEVEFLALSFIIIYVGAVAMFFLFMLILLDIKISDSSFILLKHRFLFLVFVTFFSFEVTSPFLGAFSAVHPTSSFFGVDWFFELNTFSNLETVGQTLYTFHFFLVLIAGFVLFVSILGIIMLVLAPSS